ADESRKERRQRRSYSASEADARRWAADAAALSASNPLPVSTIFSVRSPRSTTPPPTRPPVQKQSVTVAVQTDPVDDEDFAWETETVAFPPVEEVPDVDGGVVRSGRRSAGSERTFLSIHSDPSTLTAPSSPLEMRGSGGFLDEEGPRNPRNSRSLSSDAESDAVAVAAAGAETVVKDEIRMYFSEDEIREFSGLLDGLFFAKPPCDAKPLRVSMDAPPPLAPAASVSREPRARRKNPTLLIPTRGSSMAWGEEQVAKEALWSAGSSSASSLSPPLALLGSPASSPIPFLDALAWGREGKKEVASLDEVFNVGWTL
ncbi:hypothetical protein HDU67_004396, partial [Dinochytrium kinnereticum]